MQKAKWPSEEALQIAVKRRDAKGKGEKERYTHLDAEFQRIARRDKKAFLSDQCKEIEENNRMGKTRDLFKKIRDTKGAFHANMGSIKDRNGMDLTEAEDIKLDGHDSTYFSIDGHVHDAATTSSNGFMSNTDKTKLDGIATGAEVNQNAFANVAVGSTTIQADAKQDTLTLTAGNAITLTPDATNDKVTIAVTGSTYMPLSGGTFSGAVTTASNFTLDKSGTASAQGTSIILPFRYMLKATDDSATVHTTTPFFVFPSSSTTNNGTGFGIQTGGAVVIGAGESPKSLVSAITLNGDTENLHLTADSTVSIHTNAGTIANRKTFTFTTDGKITFPDGSKIWIA